MEWEPNERDAWVADAQRWICQIKGVLQCKIDLDPDGEITGIHVVAGTERKPHRIVRDVEGLLKARLDIDVYYKKIGVVQVMNNGTAPAETDVDVETAPETAPEIAPEISATLTDLTDDDFQATATDELPQADGVQTSGAESTSGPTSEQASEPTSEATPEPAPTAGESEPSPEAESATETAGTEPEPMPAVLIAEEINPRIVCSGVGVMSSELAIRAEVQLRAGDLEARGTSEGPNHPRSDAVQVARATLEAVGRLLNDPVLLHLAELKLTQLGGQDVVMAAVDLTEGRRSETLFGACSSGHNRQQAVVYAVLDALNRRLALYALKSAEAHG